MADIRRIPNSFRPDPVDKNDPPKEEDPKTEAMRQALKGHPFAKKYHGKEFNR
jgi:hypothetical protein